MDLIQKLDSNLFAEREAASVRLKDLGCVVERSLREALSEQRTLEQKKRIEALLKTLDDQSVGPTKDDLLAVRVVAVLEGCGTANA